MSTKRTFYLLAIFCCIISSYLFLTMNQGDTLTSEADLLTLKGRIHKNNSYNQMAMDVSKYNFKFQLGSYENMFYIPSELNKIFDRSLFEKKVHEDMFIQVMIKDKDRALLNSKELIPVYGIHYKKTVFLETSSAIYYNRYNNYIQKPLFAIGFILLAAISIWYGRNYKKYPKSIIGRKFDENIKSRT